VLSNSFLFHSTASVTHGDQHELIAHSLTRCALSLSDKFKQEKQAMGRNAAGMAKPVTQRTKVTTMRKIHLLATAAAVLIAATAPGLAASRTHRAVDAFASGAVTQDRSGAYHYGPQSRAYSPGLSSCEDGKDTPNFGRNLPYPDRLYGAPDSW
jgi:hypothetical protein